jgi:hypothetical protein
MLFKKIKIVSIKLNTVTKNSLYYENMKKINLILAIITLSFSIANAQTEQTDLREELQLGIKLGANYSNIYDEQGGGFKTEPKFGFVGGVFFSIPIGKYLGVQPEILFSQKGFKASGTILDQNYTYTRTTNSIDIPLLIQLKPSAVFTILAGPQYSYLMRQKDTFGDASVEQDFNNDNIRKNIFCFLGGIDINLERLMFGARVGWDIQRNNGDGTSTNPRYKNVWYQATLGISL